MDTHLLQCLSLPLTHTHIHCSTPASTSHIQHTYVSAAVRPLRLLWILHRFPSSGNLPGKYSSQKFHVSLSPSGYDSEHQLNVIQVCERIQYIWLNILLYSNPHSETAALMLSASFGRVQEIECVYVSSRVISAFTLKQTRQSEIMFVYVGFVFVVNACLTAWCTSRHNRNRISQSWFRHFQLFILLLRFSGTVRGWVEGGAGGGGRSEAMK